MLHKEQILEENQTYTRSSGNLDTETNHRAALEGVIDLDCSIKGQTLHLIRIETHGGGAGAAAFRELFILRKNRGLTDRIYAGSSGTNSFLFYLYMGMIPCQFDFDKRIWIPISQIYIPYIDTFFIEEQGDVNKVKSKMALETLTAYLNGDEISAENKIILKMILHQEKIRRKETLDPNYKLMTDDDLKNNQATLLEIKNKQITELEGIFIPNVLEDLHDGMYNKEIDLHRSGGVLEFQMTDAGFERADDAISKSEKIKSFKHLEHLPLTPLQKEKLDNIIKQREEFMRKNSSSDSTKMFSGKSFIKPNNNVTPSQRKPELPGKFELK